MSGILPEEKAEFSEVIKWYDELLFRIRGNMKILLILEDDRIGND